MTTLETLLTAPVHDVITRHPPAARALGHCGIDLCRSWALAVATAARVAGVQPETVARDVLATAGGRSSLGDEARSTARDSHSTTASQ